MISVGPRPPQTVSRSQHPFELLEQSSPYQERITINGVQKRVHVVVKKSPFQLNIGSKLGVNMPFDFNQFTYDAILLYDADETKQVSYVKDKPLEVRFMVSDSGEELIIELKIKVLTSQHENSLFRIKVIVLDPNTGHPYHPSWYILTGPIKVISKPELSKRRKAFPSESTSNSNQKRKANDLVAEAVARLSEQQKQQQEVIQRFMNSKISTNPNIIHNAVDNSSELKKDPPSEENIESVFYDFFNIFLRMSPQDKAVKIRKLVRNSSIREKEEIQDMLGTFAQEMSVRQAALYYNSLSNWRQNQH